MRVFAVIFALAALSGCYTRSVPQNDLETASEMVKDYLDGLSAKFQDFKVDMESKLHPYAQEAVQNLGEDVRQLGTRLGNHMAEGREQLDRYREELQSVMEQNVEDLQTRGNAYFRKLKKRIHKDTQETQRQVSDSYQDLQSRFYRNMEEMRTLFNTQMQPEIQGKLDSLKQAVEGQVNSLTHKAGELFEADGLGTMLRDKMEEFRVGFESLVSSLTGSA